MALKNPRDLINFTTQRLLVFNYSTEKTVQFSSPSMGEERKGEGYKILNLLKILLIINHQ